MRFVCAKNYEDMSRKAANILSAQIIVKPSSILGLATGSTPIGIYQQLIQIEEKRDLSEAEIDVMIQQYNQTRSNINGKIQAATQQQQQRPVKNPF